VQLASGSVQLPAPTRTRPGWLAETSESLTRFALLFLLGLFLLGLAPGRVRTVQAQIAAAPLRALANGFLGAIGGSVFALVLAITIIGIPAAIVVALALASATYAGLAASAAVVGGILPVAALRDRPVLQLAAGVLVLFVASRVPIVGPLLTMGATLIGLGAVVLTRAGDRAVSHA
jgi:hypothetical protein